MCPGTPPEAGAGFHSPDACQASHKACCPGPCPAPGGPGAQTPSVEGACWPRPGQQLWTRVGASPPLLPALAFLPSCSCPREVGTVSPAGATKRDTWVLSLVPCVISSKAGPGEGRWVGIQGPQALLCPEVLCSGDTGHCSHRPWPSRPTSGAQRSCLPGPVRLLVAPGAPPSPV